MFVFLISAAITVFLIVAALLVMLTGTDPVEERLMDVSAQTPEVSQPLIAAAPSTGLARVAGEVTRILQPFRGLVTGFDLDLAYKLTLAGFRKPEHMETSAACVGNCRGKFLSQQHDRCSSGWRVGRIFSPGYGALLSRLTPASEYPVRSS